MRLFTAINFSDNTRSRLLALRDELQAKSRSGNFTAPENLHLTLVFLGECDEKQTVAAKMAINSVNFEPFILTIAGGGYLDKGRSNLVFSEIKNDSGRNKLQKLRDELSTNFSAKGFELDGRKFWPHITLGREVVWKDIGDYSSFIDARFPTIEAHVTSIELMKSERVGGKLTYTAIYERKSNDA
ncbi:RNA 2',3'-cyclic phosphodiesterase [Betaproteobacteria bacterium]|nr:RNA 2',3'-cyclic phosphodiesterase [Betaproteobacteria bacterium]